MTTTRHLRLTVPMGAVLLTFGCTSGNVDQATFEPAVDANAPLAIFESSAESGSQEAYGPGELTRSGDCIYLRTGDAEAILLGWPSAATTWSAELDSVGFQPPATNFASIAVGETVVVGGGEINTDNVTWLTAPEACPNGDWVGVSSITAGTSP